MNLSDEQMAAVHHGASHDIEWHFVDRPIGPQPIPAWCKGVHILWMDGYANAPDVRLKVAGNLRDWPNKRFRKEGSRYIAESEDGRAEQYAHSGTIRPATVKRFQSADGPLRQYRRSGIEWAETGKKGMGQMHAGNGIFADYGYEPGEWIDVTRLATTEQQGFGGAQIDIVLDDGSDLVLRGPWHTGAPEGFVEVAYVDCEKRYRSKLPWQRDGGIGGLFLRDDLFIRIMSRFAAHVPLVRVKHSYGWRVEPAKPEWDAPKAVIYEREWQAKKAAREAAKRDLAYPVDAEA